MKFVILSVILSSTIMQAMDNNMPPSDRHKGLRDACRKNNRAQVLQWLKFDAPVDGKGEKGEAALHILAQKGNAELMKHLIEERKALVNIRDAQGRTPLHWAVFHDNQDAAELLIEHGAQINEQDNNQMTPLHLACSNEENNECFVRYLLRKGAQWDLKNDCGETPRELALKHTAISILVQINSFIEEQKSLS